MRFEFPYRAIPGVQIPDENLRAVLRPQPWPAPARAEQIIAEALVTPIGSPRLRDLVPDRGEIVVVVDDLTRHTPLQVAAPLVAEELLAGGASEAQIKFLLGLGTHRAMTPEEIEQHLGAEISRRFEVINHDCRDPAKLVDLGKTPGGTQISVSKLAYEAGLLLSIGHIAPHRIAGFTGGGKAIQPGVCGTTTTAQTHWASVPYGIRNVIGVRDNPIRAEIDSVALRTGLKFIVNAVLNARRQTVACFAGDPIEAHRAGAKIAREIARAPLPRAADISIGASYPVDIDLWQAAKAVFPLAAACRTGGTAIMVTPCPEGVSQRHPEVLQYGYRPVAEIQRMVAAREYTDVTAAAHAALVSQDAAERIELVLVSSGISVEEIRRLKLTPAATAQEALDLALERHGHGATVVALELAGELLVEVGQEAQARR